MKKQMLSIMLAICMVLMLVPTTAFAATGTGSTPSVSAYATKEQLMDGTFAPDSNGNAMNIGKLIFGKKSIIASQEWYILGKDDGVSGDNTVIFAASPRETRQAFNSIVQNKNYSYDAETGYGGNAGSIEVYANHYGASDLREALQTMATNLSYFTITEQDMMNVTTVTTWDTKNSKSYTTSDKLYALAADGSEYNTIKAGSNNDKILPLTTYYCSYGWLRSPDVNAAHNTEAWMNGIVKSFCVTTIMSSGVYPATNLKLSSVLFASAATAASSDTATSATIASDKAMTLRLDGSSKNIGTVEYRATTGDIKAIKGSTAGNVALVVQGKDGTNDWYYSKGITGTETLKASTIKRALGLSSDIDLSACKIWIETTEDNVAYAVEATVAAISDISSVGITGIDNPSPNTALDLNASCATPGVSSTTPSVTWTPEDSTAGYNTRYTASVTLTPAPFYQFTDSTTANVNGNVAASVTKNQNGTLTVTYQFPATAKDKLNSITAPQAITVANGTAYENMKLPATVNIVTEGSTETSALVTWNTTTPASGSYDPNVLTEQTVTLNGTVTCPETIDANRVSLTTTITITISAADTVATPQANLTSGVYTSNQSVILSSATEGAEIYYTTDGSVPSSTNGTKYTEAISVTGTELQSVETTIKAIAVKDRMQDSAVATFTYSIKIPDTTKPTGEISIGTNKWTELHDKIDFKLSFSGTQTVTITAKDNSGGEVTIEYLLSDKELTNTDLVAAKFTTYTEAFRIKPYNQYVIYAKLTDASGNVAYINSDGIVLYSIAVSCTHTGGTATCKEKAKCEICGEPYGELDSTNHNLENIPAKDATAAETGNIEYWHCKDCENNFSDPDGKDTIELKDAVIAKLPPEIMEGMGQSVTAGEKKDLIFRSNAAFGDFIRAELDGKTMDEKNYTVNEGSTVVTLKAAYVAALSAGEHTIGIVSESGTAVTTFTVLAAAGNNAWDKTVLRLQATASKTAIKMKWEAVPGADGYVIYWNTCGSKAALKQIKVIKNRKTLTWTHKNLEKNSQNRYCVKAYKMIGGKKYFIKTSNQIHLVTQGGQYTNVKKLDPGVSSVTLKKGKSKALKVTPVYAERNKKPVYHMRPLTYTTSNKKVATVSSKGVIKAEGKGSCYIYVTAYSGVYTKVKVIVK